MSSFFDAKSLEFFSSAFYHRRWSTEVIFFILWDTLRSDPIRYISRSRHMILTHCFKVFFSWIVLDIFEIREVFSDSIDLISIKIVSKVSHSKNKCCFFWFTCWHTRGEHLTVYGSKSSTRTDKTLTPRSITQSKMSKWNHRVKDSSNFCIADEWTSSSFCNSLDDEGKSTFTYYCDGVCTVQSWSKLKHHILTRFWWFFRHFSACISKLIHIMSELFFISESDRCSKHMVIFR